MVVTAEKRVGVGLRKGGGGRLKTWSERREKRERG